MYESMNGKVSEQNDEKSKLYYNYLIIYKKTTTLQPLLFTIKSKFKVDLHRQSVN